MKHYLIDYNESPNNIDDEERIQYNIIKEVSNNFKFNEKGAQCDQGQKGRN